MKIEFFGDGELEFDPSPEGVLRASEEFLASLNQKPNDYEIGRFFHLFPDETQGPAADSWPKRWPLAELAGVYFVFDQKRVKRVLNYIGKSSMGSTLGMRLCCHFPYAEKNDKNRGCGFGGERWKRRPYFVMVIGFPVKKWLAPSLEEYLITECYKGKVENVQGNR